ncbi:MAG: Ig-like domain-containing protein [Spirochaetales bacterium]|nr:Ig-like domain-containing protein [Spirochaetales bacterium]
MKIKFILIISVIILAGCPNTMIGLGDKVDIDSPKVSIGTYGDGAPVVNGDYVRGEITLTGSTSDDIGISSVKVSFDGGLIFNSAVVAGDELSWSYTVDTSSYPDGEKDIIVLVSDTSETPKTNEERLLLYFDNTAPLVVVTVSPGFASPASDSTFSIKGEATDPYRIKRVSVSMTQGSGTLSTVEGTNSWSFVLSGAVTGAYKFEVTAEDYAGNRNTHFFHYNDVNTLNGGNYITIENLYKIENGKSVADTVITKASLEGIRLSELPLSVDMNDDVPVITISNPEVGAQLGGNAIVIGRVEDDDAVDSATLQINIDSAGWEWDSLLPGTEITGSGQAINFKYDISSLSNGTHTIQIRAADDHGTLKTSDVVSFTIDLGAPQIEITSPSQGEYLNSAVVNITGTSYDDQSVLSVKIQLDEELEADWRAASTVNSYADWSYTTPVLAEGMHSVKVYAEDGTGKVSSYNISFYVDITDPVVSFNYPVMNSEVYGDINILGVCSDNSNAFTSGYIKIGKDGVWTEVLNLNYWSYPLTNLEGTYTNSSSSDDLGGGVWQLPVMFRITDIAGNTTETTETDYYFRVNGALDKPEVAFPYPDTGFKSGGPVTVRGTSYDEQQVLRVEMQIDLTGDGDYLDTVDLNGDTDTLDIFENESQWYPVSGTLNWQQELNASGEFFAANTGGTGTVTVNVRAIDTKDGLSADITGDSQSTNITFDNSYPYFDNLSHSSFDYAKGTITLTGQAHDPQQVSSILISYNGGTSYTDITSSSTLIGALDGKDYSISQSIDTTAYIPASGVLPLKLKVVDNAGNSTDTSINLNVDNILPTGSWIGVLDDITGAVFKVQGTAVDSGTVSGIDRVEVYFIRNGNVYNPGLADTAVAAGNTDFNDGNGSVPYTTDINYKIIIDDPDELGNDSGGTGDGDNFNESLTLSGSTYSWWAEFNSANIPDGTLELHYVVWDKAGNAHHYSENGFIKNNKPTISSITVGTDLDWSGVVDPDEQFTYSGSFNAQNRLYISIAAADNDFSNLSYSIYHGSDNTGTLLSSTLDLTADITVAPYVDGSDTFFCEVTDSDGIVTSSLINLIIDNTDDIFPTISIDPLSQSSIISGHLEEAGDSLYDGTDPDVSGEINITGNAWDNQRIKSITLTLDGVGAGYVVASWVGNSLVSQDPNFVIDTYSFSEDTGLLITWTYTWDSAGVTDAAANNVSIGFEIEDYASVPNTASDSLVVDVVPYISSVQTTQLVNGGLKDQNIRAVDGKYSVKSGNTIADFITINGYNLNPITGGVRVSTSAFKSGLNGTTLAGTSLAVNTTAADFKSLTVSNDSNSSGYLSVVGGTTAVPIPSINNINNNLLSYNTESNISAGHSSLSDDRYINFFTVTRTAFDSSFFPNMMMEGNNPVFGFIQGGAANDLQVRGSTDNLTSFGLIRILAADQLAMARDDDGIYHYATANSFSQGRLVYIYDIYETTAGYTNGGCTSPYWSGYTGEFSSSAGNNAIDLDSMNYTPDLQLGRYVNLQMKVKGSSLTAGQYAKVYMSWYDNYTGEILFRNHRVGDSGGANNLFTGITTNQADISVTSADASRELVTSQASPYLAMGVTDADIVVIVYYNQTTGYLNLINSTTAVDRADTTVDITWSAPVQINIPYTGWYVSMFIETDGNSLTDDPIHLAAYDTVNADLRYIYLNSYTDTTPDSARVDAVNSVGIYSDIKVLNGVPYISYYNNSENGTRDSIKLAKFNGDPAVSVSDGASLDGLFTGDWDVMTVPVNTVPQGGLLKFLKVNLDFNLNGDPLLGYSADNLEYSVLLTE